MMPKLKIVLFISVFLTSIVFWNCSPDGDGIFIPTIDAVTWTNQADPDNTFFFLPDNTNVNTSPFTGNENQSGGAPQISFSGSFTNHNIQFTYDSNSGNKSGRTYSGTIDNTSKIMVLSGQGLPNLRLERP